MRVDFNRTGQQRKELVNAISEITGVKSEYLGAPSMAYRIGGYTVTKKGSLEFDEYEPMESVEDLLFKLKEKGIEADLFEEEPKADGLSISLPKAKMTDTVMENFKNLIESKGDLLKQALGADDLPVIDEGDKVTFPWFSGADADSTNAYLLLITKMAEMAEHQTRINPKPKEIVNAKYEFRCFLLRLGFIGAEYKGARKILLKNLTGSSAFK